MNGREEKRAGRRITVAAVVVLIGLVAGSVFLVDRFLHGDKTAPCYIVPDEWHVYLSPAEDKCAIRMEYKVKVLKTDKQNVSIVPLFPEGTIFKKVVMNDEDIIPLQKDGWYFAEIKWPGTYSVSADIDVKPEKAEGSYTCRLKKAEFIKSAVHIDSVEALELRIEGVSDFITGTAEEGTHGVLFAGLLQDVVVSWGRPKEKVVRKGTVSIKPSTVWTIKENSLSANTLLEAAVTGGSRDSVKIVLPRGADKVNVAKGVVSDWRLNGSELAMFFQGKVAGAFSINISYDVPGINKETVKCPALSVEDGRIEPAGFLLVVNDTAGVVLESSVSGLEAVSDIEVSAAVKGLARSRPLFFYRTRLRDAEPVFDVVTKELFPMVDTIADTSESLTVIYEGGEEMTRVVYAIRNNGKQFLKVRMPEKSRIISVTVDNKSRTACEKDGIMLIQLEDSIQTLGGLVPFPVEIIYCRQDTKLSAGSKARIDLPELPDVPMATVRANLFYPDTLTIKKYHSSLARVDDNGPEGSLYFWQTQAGATNGAIDFNRRVNDLWARNSYDVGYEAYRQNRLEDAEMFLAQTAQIAPGGKQISDVSVSLLDNIRAGRGEMTGKDKLERAKIASIQGTLSSMNAQIEAQQSQLITHGLANIKQGNEEVGAELLKEAEKMGARISNRSGSTLRQKAVQKSYDAELQTVEDERRKKGELEKTLSLLQTEAREIVKGAQADENKKETARKLGKGLLIAADEEKIDSANLSLSDVTWSDDREQQQVSAGAQAQTLKNRILDSGVNAPGFTMEKKPEKGLKDSNEELAKKVTVLGKALQWARSSTAQTDSQTVDYGYVRDSISKKKEAITGLRSRLARKDSANAPALNDYYQAEREISQLKEQAESSRVSFGGLDRDLNNELVQLEGEIKELAADISSGKQEISRADTVAISVTNIIDTSNLNAVRSFEKYLYKNYSPSQQDGGKDFFLEGDSLNVRNADNKPAELTEIVNKFAYNDGNAVNFAGRKMKVDVNHLPVMQGWFTNTAADGRKYAVLDEAQYRTLVYADANINGRQAASGNTEARDVIVGTSSTLNDAPVMLTEADSGGNRIDVNGNEVFLAHDNYYAEVDGDGVSVIKAGTVHYWQEDKGRVNLDVELPHNIEVPRTGRQICFGKTLLSAGESPDVELEFNN